MFGSLMSLGAAARARRGMLREWRLHTLSVFSLAVAFVCLGAALLAVTNLRALEERWTHAGRASVYVRDGAPMDEVEALKAALTKVPGVRGVRYVSSGQAKSDLVANQRADETLDLGALPAEAFPSSLEVDVQPEMTDVELSTMAAKLRQIPTVEDVETYQAWTERLRRFVRGGVTAAALLAVVVLASVLAVVSSTIRLALQRRKSEVEVLKLVGASDGFVKGPFVIEGGIQGATGAVAAIVLLAALFFLVRARMDGEFATLIGLEPSFLPWQVAVGMVVVGGVLGAFAALLSLRKLVMV